LSPTLCVDGFLAEGVRLFRDARELDSAIDLDAVTELGCEDCEGILVRPARDEVSTGGCCRSICNDIDINAN
jgi:hypothetical protein